VTGGDQLYNRLISDDCETSASFIMGVHKTFMWIRAYMVSIQLWKDDTLDHAAFCTAVASMTEDQLSKLIGDDRQLFTDRAEGKAAVFALGNILRQYHLRVELCIGSASSAAIGMPESPSGHCFAMLDAVHATDLHPPRSFILEGTNWIAQRSLLGIHGINQQAIWSFST
jgi:hypothetical protein